MSQNALAPINPATTSGTDLATKLVNNEGSVLTQYSGSSRPSYAQSGTLWLDTTTNPWLWKIYNGSTDIVISAFSTGASGREREGVVEASIASAATTNVTGSTSKFISITGSASITSLGTEPNVIKFVRAAAAATFTLTHNATTLILPTGANITAAAGDSFIVLSDNSGNVRVMAYQRASGAALVAAAGDVPSGSVALFRQTAAPSPGWTKDTTNYNDHMIRIVTGTASSGGTINLSTVIGYTSTQSYTLTTSDIPAHSHASGTLATSTDGSHSHSLNNASNVVRAQDSGKSVGTGSNNWTDDNISVDSGGSHSHDVTGDTSSSGGGGSHSHNIDMRAKYVDAIWATKS